MANSIDAYIPELWANESVAILVENLVIANLVHQDFSPLVANFGDTVHTRQPAEFIAKRKTDADSVTIQNADATNIPVVLNQHFHTSFMIKDGEESKSFKMLRDEYLAPAVTSIARAVDMCLLGESHQFLGNAEGIANGLTTSNIIQYIVETRKRMNINKAFEQNRNLILTPNTEAIALQTGTFHEADKLGDNGTAMREASLGRKFQFNTFMSQNSPSTIGGPTFANASLVDNASGYPAGATLVHVDGAGAALKVGMWFKIAGDGILHEITALGSVVTQDVDVTFTPPLRAAVADDAALTVGDVGLINFASGYAAGYAKELVVDGIVGIVPVGALIKFATPGTPSVIKSGVYSVIATTETAGDTTGITLNRPLDVALVNNDEINFGVPANHNFAFHRNALALVSRPLAPAPRGLALSSIANMAGVGMSVTITYDGSQQGVLVTCDLLCGIKVLDTDLGAVLIG
jgi:hypothetical protein